ncbi:MAG: protein kinase [Candidatus Eisenbacteria bacterium]
MPLTPGQKLASYEILAPLGAGGMGEVWRARDTRLGREVAIKALPDAFAQDPERLARFEREAKLLASLNHPNIGAIYGFEVVDGHRYLVLEFIEGDTLEDMLLRGPLPVGEAIEICGHVASALESAHESGIVHRDLKPANVMLTRVGTVKVLDFGLAKGGVTSDSDPALSASPTMTYGATQAGMVLGTAAYMSPEQARGKAVDKRTDIWSFGCVLFECLTGKQAFEGETVSDLIAHILTSDPDWNALPPATPPRVRELLRRCLEKDARRRLRDMGDARIELEEVLSPRGSASSAAVSASIAGAVDAATAAQASRKRSAGVGMQIAAAIVGAVLAVIATKLISPLVGGKPDAARVPVRFEIPEAPGMAINLDGANQAISPDGTRIVFVAGDSLKSRLWVRTLETLSARPLDGTEDGTLPFWSPDGRNIGFFTETKLKRVHVSGGEVDELCDVKRARGGTWNQRDQILFAGTSDGPLSVIAAAGGEPHQVTVIDSASGETAHRSPEFLPDGKHFLFSSLPPRQGKFTIKVGELGGAKPESLLTTSSGVRYARPGYLLSLSRNVLTALPFDLSSRRGKGSPIVLRDLINPSSYSGAAGFSVSEGGRIAYPSFLMARSRLVWFDPITGATTNTPIEPAQYLGGISLSPDDRRVATTRAEGSDDPEIWVGDLERGVISRFSQEHGACDNPAWSPDGRFIAYSTSTVGPQSLVVRALSGDPAPRTFGAADPAFKFLRGWTPDGSMLVYGRQAAATRWDIWLQPVEPGAPARAYLQSPFNETYGEVSPDGRWMAYLSDESGRTEVYVQSFPTPGSKYQVTTGGTGPVAWSPGGKGLMFGLEKDPSALQVAEVIPGPEFRLGPAHSRARLPSAILGGNGAHGGRRVLLVVIEGNSPTRSLTVVLDWTAALREKK